jgi:hypothetical protein
MTEKTNNAAYSKDKAAEREAKRYFQKYEADQDKRSDFQKFKDTNAAKADAKRAQKNNEGVTGQAQLAESVRNILSSVTPGWKMQPVEKAIPETPLPPREINVWPMQEVAQARPQQRTIPTATTYPLKLVQLSDTSYEVLDGEVGGYAITGATYTGVTTTKYVWVEVTQSYDTATGIWSATAATLATPAGSYGSPSSTKQIVKLGVITCSGSIITDVAQASGGNQWVARTGNGSGYVDSNGGVSPV